MIQKSLFCNFYENFRFIPTHSIVVNLKKARKHLSSFEMIDSLSAEKTIHSFRRALSKKCLSKSAYRRFKTELSAIAGIEISADNRRHFHMLIKKPESFTNEDFEKAILETSKRNPYIECGPYSVHITDIQNKGESDITNIIQYNMKDIFKNTGSFVM